MVENGRNTGELTDVKAIKNKIKHILTFYICLLIKFISAKA